MKTSLFRPRRCNLHGMSYYELYYCRFFSQMVWYEVLVCNHVISRQCWGSIEFFLSVNLHYSRVLNSSQRREMLLLLTTNMVAVTSRANHQRHQLRINKAANSSRAPTRQSNFCHSNNYLLFIPPFFWLPDFESHIPAANRDQGSFSKQEREPWERGWSTSNRVDQSIYVCICLVPDVSLSMKMCAPSVPFPWSLAIHHQSLAFRACLLWKTKRLRRRLCMHNKSMGFSTKILLLWHLFSEINYFLC